MKIINNIKILSTLLVSLNYASNGFAQTAWKLECLEAIAQEQGATAEDWKWSVALPTIHSKGNSNKPHSAQASISGVLKSQNILLALEATCQFPIVAPYNRKPDLTWLPAEAVGPLKSFEIVSKVKVQTPWKATKAAKLYSLNREFANELDGLFGETVDEGSFDADVKKHGAIPAVDCAPRKSRGSGLLKFICKFDIKVVPIEGFGERRDTTCTIRYSESKDYSQLGEPILEQDENDAQLCIEDVGSGD